MSFSLINGLIFPLNHGGSLSSQTITSWGMKLLKMFTTVSLKIKTFLFSCLFAEDLSQSNSLTDCQDQHLNLDSAKPRGCKVVGKEFQD